MRTPRSAEKLGPVDNAWLRMDRADNPMIITGLLAFGGSLAHEDLRALVRDRLLRFDRFRQRVVRGGARDLGRWEDPPAFNLDAHLVLEILPPPADREVVRARVGAIMGERLPMDRPPWRVHHLAGFDGGKSVLVCRLHHCIADGFALMHVMMSLTDDDPVEGAVDSPPSAATRGRHVTAQGATLRARVRDGVTRLRNGIGHLLLMPRESPNPLRGPLDGTKRAAWSAPIPLDRIKRIGRAHRGTVNHVLLAGVAGALRRWALTRGPAPLPSDIRAVVPIALREPAEMETLGNYFGLAFLELPIGRAEPRTRLRTIADRIEALKASAEPLLSFWILAAAGLATRRLEQLVVRLFASKTSLIVTNVPGPTAHRWMAGRRIETILFWVPQSASVSVGISLFSYAGEVRIGVATDAALVPDPTAIVDAFAAELDALDPDLDG